MFWIILIVIAVIIMLVMFANDVSQDKEELRESPLEQKFSTLIHELNEYAYNGNGQVNKMNIREVSLYEPKQNHILNFIYHTGALTIVWSYKYFHKEVKHEKTIDEASNLTPQRQKQIADELHVEMRQVIAEHQTMVQQGLK